MWRRRRRLTLAEYVATRCEDYRKLGGVVVSEETLDTGDGVKIHAEISFGSLGAFNVYEVITEVDGTAVRTKYGYGARYDADFLFRYDLDPDNHSEMPSHKHLPGDRRIPSPEVSMTEAADELWQVVLEREAEGEAESRS